MNEMVKNVLGLAVGFSVGTGSGVILSNIARAFTPPNLSLSKRVGVKLAVVTLSSVLGDVAQKHVVETVDTLYTSGKTTKKELQKIFADAMNTDNNGGEK